MREIKFRAWDKINTKMIYSPIWISDTYGERSGVIGLDGSVGLLFKSSKGLEIKEAKDQFILQQFTGLLDKNGKEIYEGDIVKVPDDYEEYGMLAGETREIYYLDGCFRLKPKHEINIKRGDRGHTIEDDMDKCEIIGNIYENPELLAPSRD